MLDYKMPKWRPELSQSALSQAPTTPLTAPPQARPEIPLPAAPTTPSKSAAVPMVLSGLGAVVAGYVAYGTYKTREYDDTASNLFMLSAGVSALAAAAFLYFVFD